MRVNFIYISIYISAADQDYLDSMIIMCERLLVAVLMLSEIDYLSVSDKMLSGIDAVYDSIEEIVAVLPPDDTKTQKHVTSLAQPSLG